MEHTGVLVQRLNMFENKWSGRGDLNSRPLGPEPSALPSCATPRFGLIFFEFPIFMKYRSGIILPYKAVSVNVLSTFGAPAEKRLQSVDRFSPVFLVDRIVAPVRRIAISDF